MYQSLSLRGLNKIIFAGSDLKGDTHSSRAHRPSTLRSDFKMFHAVAHIIICQIQQPHGSVGFALHLLRPDLVKFAYENGIARIRQVT